MNKTTQAHSSPKDIAASLALVAKAAAPFSNVVLMTASEKKRVAKLRRGAQQIIPMIGHLATKFAVSAPGTSIDDMTSNIDHATALEPLLGAVAALHEAIRDEYLRAQSSAWGTAVVSYAMLKHASRANGSLATEMTPVVKWFRQATRGTSASSSTGASTAPTTQVVTNGATVHGPATPATVTGTTPTAS